MMDCRKMTFSAMWEMDWCRGEWSTVRAIDDGLGPREDSTGR